MKYRVKIPYHSYTEHIVDTNSIEEAIEIAIAINDETEQLLGNVEQDGDVEVEEIGDESDEKDV